MAKLMFKHLAQKRVRVRRLEKDKERIRRISAQYSQAS
jgi:hypothetical protein